jgi:hypothetical protein
MAIAIISLDHVTKTAIDAAMKVIEQSLQDFRVMSCYPLGDPLRVELDKVIRKAIEDQFHHAQYAPIAVMLGK